jgi:hypothetical protein
MTAKELAAQLDGNKYDNEITKEQEALAADNGLVVVFGYSDDVVILCGAIDDEVGAFDGTTFHVTRDGVLLPPEDHCDNCTYFEIAKRAASEIKAVWGNTGNPCWTFETVIPHETFRIYEDEELFCVGIVFRLDDLN